MSICGKCADISLFHRFPQFNFISKCSLWCFRDMDISDLILFNGPGVRIDVHTEHWAASIVHYFLYNVCISWVTGAHSLTFSFELHLIISHLIQILFIVSCSRSPLLRWLPAPHHPPTSCTTPRSTCSPTQATALRDRLCPLTPTIQSPCR